MPNSTTSGPKGLSRRYRPPGKVSDLYVLYVASCGKRGGEPASPQFFRRIWHTGSTLSVGHFHQNIVGRSRACVRLCMCVSACVCDPENRSNTPRHKTPPGASLLGSSLGHRAIGLEWCGADIWANLEPGNQSSNKHCTTVYCILYMYACVHLRTLCEHTCACVCSCMCTSHAHARTRFARVPCSPKPAGISKLGGR